MSDFITGATGCLGRSLLKVLLARGRRVICAVRDPQRLSRDPLFTKSEVSLVKCDFAVPGWENEIASTLAQCENVFHAAAEMPHRPSCRGRADILRKVNVDATRKLYDLAQSAKRFLYVSSIAIYGDSFPDVRSEDGRIAPGDFYAASKFDAEQALLQAPDGGPAIFIVRPGLIYGEGDTNAARKIIELADRGRFRVLGNGTNVRALAAAPLVAEVLCRLSDSEERGPVVMNVVDPNPPTVRQFADDIARFLGKPRPGSLPLPLVYLPAALFSLLNLVGFRNRFKLSDVRKISTSNPINSARLKALFSEVPNFYEEALSADVAWYRNHEEKRSDA